MTWEPKWLSRFIDGEEPEKDGLVHIYVRERGTAVFIIMAISPSQAKPASILFQDLAVLEVPGDAKEIFNSLLGFNCFRGFKPDQLNSLRIEKRLQLSKEEMLECARDK